MRIFSLFAVVNCSLAFFLGCGISTLDMLNGKFISLDKIVFTKVEAISPTLVELRFEQEIKSSSVRGVQNFLITNSDSEVLETIAVFQDSQFKQTFRLTTDVQAKGAEYNLTVQGLEGVDNSATGKKGVSFVFNGFDPTLHPRYFRVTPAELPSFDKNFNIIVEAIDTNSGNLLLLYNEEVVITSTGVGILAVVSKPGFIEGTQEVSLKYSNDLILDGQIESMAIVVSDSIDSTFRGSSENIEIRKPASHASFQIDLDDVYIAQPFEVAITAIGSDGFAFADYDGSVTLSATAGTGELSPLSASGFTDGVLKIEMNYTAVTEAMQINVVDNGDSSLQGISKTFTVGMGLGGNFSINLAAVPLDATTIRLNWNKMSGATAYNIYRKDAQGFYIFIDDVSPNLVYLDTGQSSGKLNEYKVTAMVGQSIIGTAFAKATPNNCTIANIENPITQSTTWTKTNSPYCVISSDLEIESDLFLEPGVVVIVDSGFKIIITNNGTITYGQFNAEGSRDEPVIFTSSNPAPAAGDWGGIEFETLAIGSTINASFEHISGSLFSFCLIEYAGPGIRTSAPLAINYTIFRQNRVLGTGSTDRGAGLISGADTISIQFSSFLGNSTEYGGGCSFTYKNSLSL